MTEEGYIKIRGAKVNNLKNISIDIPRGKFTVITGISGSGKSSLAFDTLFAEGQRRFAESLSSYARQFLGRMSKPDVEAVEGIPPAIAIEQKVNIRNPRSTVATTTEIYDYLRIIFARIGRTYSPISGVEVKCHSANDVMAFIMEGESPSSVYLFADLNWDKRDDKVELLISLKEEGYSRLYSQEKGVVRIDDLLRSSSDGDFPEGLVLMIDRVKIPAKATGIEAQSALDDLRTRLHASIATCFGKGNGQMYVRKELGEEVLERSFVSRFEADGMTFSKPDEYMFSFNSPLGACPVCGGLGTVIGVSEDLVVPDKTLSIYDGAIACWRGEKMIWFKDQMVGHAQKYGIPIFDPYCSLSPEVKALIWDGHKAEREEDSLIGINEFFKWVESNRYKIQYKYLLSRFSGRAVCHECKGSRLRKDALYVKVGGKTIFDLLQMTAADLLEFFKTIELTEYERSIVRKAIEEIVSRLQYISDVGLDYLTLNRACNTLSGGESQRINLVTALGSSLVGSMYILDEPSIGLHPRDTERLIGVLKRLRDIGNTVVVVEHDEEIIRAADNLVDMGPFAGINGGEIVFNGNAGEVRPEGDCGQSLTLQYITGQRPRFRREKRQWTYSINVEGAMEHNLKDISVKFPLGVLTVVSGVSGSGKSSLVGDILYPALYRKLNETGQLPGVFRKLTGNIDRISAVEYVDQNPIGKSSRSNAVTYLKIYDDIRKLMSEQQFAKANGFTPSYFSFNQEGGRCSECQGEGYVHIGMQFMADVTMLCESCAGKRFKPDILEVRYKGKNIDDILNMSVGEAIDFFGAQPESEAQTIKRKLQPLVDVGLSYIKLGQSSSTLSGGESQRIKLAYFLSMSNANASRGNAGVSVSDIGGGINNSSRKKIMFIFDEPTTGLHFFDVEKLIAAFDALLDKGHTIVVVEHNPDVIRSADWIVELGPEAGARGGNLVFQGTPEELLARGDTITSRYI